MGTASKVPTDASMSPEVRSFLDTAQKALDALETTSGTLGTAAFLDVGTTASKVMQLDAAAKIPALDGSQLTNLPAQTGRLVAGTSLVLNPYALSTTATQAHGLGVSPVVIEGYFECLTAERGYSIGDKVLVNKDGVGGSNLAYSVTYDATNLNIATSNAAVYIVPKTGGAGATITAASWKFALTPYKLI